MGLTDDKRCKGCICSSCKNSTYNGAMYKCNANRCNACDDESVLRLQFCCNYVPIETFDVSELRL